MNRTTGAIALSAMLLGRFDCAASPPSVAVFVDFETAPSEESVSQMKLEIAEILRPSGVLLDWHSLSARQNLETFPELVVLRFEGSCRVRDPLMDSELGPGFRGGTLASTAVSDGQVLPFSSVRCDEIKKYLASELAHTTPGNRDTMYGKALGRIVAHELYHMLASTGQHGKAGIARATHSRLDLTQNEFRFSPDETALLHDRWMKALLSGEAQRVGW